MTTSFRASGITTHLGHNTILSGLDLPELQSGRIYALMGPNGSGKSTLLKSLAGLIKCHVQSLTYAGKPLTSDTLHQTQTLFGYLPQSLPEGPNLTVVEAMRVALANTIAPEKNCWHQQVEETLNKLNILPLAHTRADRLSGGQKQLVALGQLLCKKPRILLLDEPFSALDMAHTYSTMRLLKELTVQQDLVTIFVSHDLNFALSNADVAMLMHNGCIEHTGSPESVLTPDHIAEIFGIHSRVEYCSRGNPFILIDGPATSPF